MIRHLLLLAATLVLSACAPLPPQTTSTRHVGETPETTAAITPPSLRPVRLPAMPPLPTPRAAQEVFSVVVNDVPVKTLLFALARDNKLNVDIHPSVGGRVTLNATDQTLPQLLERIAAQSDIRYEISGNLLRVQPDTPYLINYTIDYVNLQRQSSSNVSVSASLGAGGGGGGSSDSSIKSSADNRFWDTLISNVCQIVLASNQNRNQRDEQIELQRQQDRDDRLRVALEITKALQPAGQGGAGQASPGSTGGSLSGSAGDLMRQVMGAFGATSGSANSDAAVAAIATGGASNAVAAGGRSGSAGASGGTASVGGSQNNNAAAQAAGASASCGSAGGGASSGSPASNPLMVNKESGVIGVNTTSKGHQQVRTFIDKVMAGARRQVLIEATVVEVQLSADSQSGVNWSQLITNGTAKGLSIGLGAAAPGFVSNSTAGAGGASIASIGYKGDNAWGTISSAISLLEKFGQAKVLSSPKLSVINNQTAIIKVVDDYVYVTISYIAPTFSASGGVTSPATYTSNINTIPVGFVMTVTPQISDAGDVTLNVHPSITRVVSKITDPNPALLNSTPPIVNLLPVVQTREL